MTTERYFSLLQQLFQINLNGGIKLGLDNIEHLHALHDSPAHSYPTIHVAGTNGKGSVCTKIAKALQHSGYCVGLYTSPHIASFRERIQINGVMISKEAVVELLEGVLMQVGAHRIPATFFELTTLLAFLYFRQQRVDAAVIEVGLGGRYDATNILQPRLSVITSISLDHTELLGETVEAIAAEKAGIIKKEVPVVIGPTVPSSNVMSIAKSKNAPCIEVKGEFWDYDQENNAVARASLELLKNSFSISDRAIELGLKARPSCRLESIEKEGVHFILDVGHNPAGLEALCRALEKQYPGRKWHWIIGLSSNKDVFSCLKVIKEHALFFHLVEAKNGRARPAKELTKFLIDLKVPGEKVAVYETIASAVETAGRMSQHVVICGTFFIMAESRRALGISDEWDEIEMNERNKGPL